jgi:5-carboxymethyl-2-hydroxymuconate isomerase
MPHLVIVYSPNLDAKTNLSALCRQLADAMLTLTDEKALPVFPKGGTRVLAYAANHYAISDGGAAGLQAGGTGEYGFAYFNLRMGLGRSEAVKTKAGELISACVQQHFAPLLAQMPLGLTVQVDEGHEVFDKKISSLHPLFNTVANHV